MTTHDIENIILNVSGLDRSAVFTKSRKHELVKARQLIQFFIKENFPKLKLREIGDLISLDHATILHSITQVENLEFQKWQPYLDWKAEIARRIDIIKKPNINILISKYSQIYPI